MNERYGVALHTDDVSKQGYFMQQLGSRWILDFTPNPSRPAGMSKVIYWGNVSMPTNAEISSIVTSAPGSVWYLFGEANRRHPNVNEVIATYHDLYAAIKAADPTAKVTSPSVLNWRFTCTLCGGYKSGETWMIEFRAAYLQAYGQEPPFDIWAIDVYPIDWDRPINQNLPTTDAPLAIAQVADMRTYMSGLPAHSAKPIWITELGLLWGYDQINLNGFCPAGTYQTSAVVAYFNALYAWLGANAESKNIEKWFVFKSYHNLTECNESAYAGASLFNGSEPGATLSATGQAFKDAAAG
jgi:hypothetical protein